jgi:2-amino-4-hydroxy-6-hydroxymethyldihydropteridine diphosphokinase
MSEAKHHLVWISVGSNLGDKMENCRRAIIALTSCGDAALRSRSPFYRTAPVDYENQDWFVNAVLLIETTLGPEALLDRLKAIERGAGRKQDGIRFGPRPLDLDILFFDDIALKTSEFTIPHPRLHKRRFVLQPLCDIDPHWQHPVLGCDVQTLLDRLPPDEQPVERVPL